jgi:tetratricopeptide (TPR) repeat protein
MGTDSSFPRKVDLPTPRCFSPHIDAHGNDSPAILVENSTAANRAVNIPEFVNIPPDGLLKINAPAAESVRICDHAVELMRKGQYGEALAEWRKAVETDPEDDDARNGLAVSLARNGSYDEALENFRKATELNPRFVDAYYNLGVHLAQMGKLQEVIAEWQKAVEITPNYAKGHYSLGDAYYQMGRIPEALAHWRLGIRIDPDHLQVLNIAAWVLATSPDTLVRNGAEAVAFAECAVSLPGGEKPEILDMLAAAYAEAGRFSDAAKSARHALVLATQENNQALVEGLKARMALCEAGNPFRDKTPRVY